MLDRRLYTLGEQAGDSLGAAEARVPPPGPCPVGEQHCGSISSQFKSSSCCPRVSLWKRAVVGTWSP